MAITKQKIQDKVEIVTPFKHIQIRYANQIVEDGSIIASSFERYVVPCGDWDKAEEHNISSIANAVWTEEMIAEYQASLVID